MSAKLEVLSQNLQKHLGDRIESIKVALGEITIDVGSVNYLEVMTLLRDEPELRFIHLRPMGSSDKGILTGRLRHGFGQYFMGTSLLYMTASAVFRLRQPPVVIGGLASWWGYVRSLLQRRPRYVDPEFRRYLREYHWLCLTRGKRRAVEDIRRRYPATASVR